MRAMNFKLDDTASALFEEVRGLAAESLGFEPSQSQLVSLALKALRDKLASENPGRKKTDAKKEGGTR